MTLEMQSCNARNSDAVLMGIASQDASIKARDQLLNSEGSLTKHVMVSCHQSMSWKYDPA